jgi:regulator of Ty1 transposition protein 103
MTGFTESALIKRLMDLNPSQQSIQTLSLWLIHHRKHHPTIVKIWFKEMCKGMVSLSSLIFWYGKPIIRFQQLSVPSLRNITGNKLDF